MEDQIFHVRVGLSRGDEHHIFTFYNVRATGKFEAGQIAKKHAALQFGGEPKEWDEEYVWDAGLHVDLKKDPIKPSDDRTFTLDDMKKSWLSGFGTASLKGSSGFMKEWFNQRYKITIKD